MHRVASRAEVARYLMLMKTYAGNWLEVAHRSQGPDKNYDFLRRYGLLIEDVRDILTSLVADDYSDGPCCDDKQLGRPDVWKFGKTVELEGEDWSCTLRPRLVIEPMAWAASACQYIRASFRFPIL